MSFYSVLGGYCIQYTALNMAELSFDLSNSLGGTAGGGAVFTAMLKAPFGAQYSRRSSSASAWS